MSCDEVRQAFSDLHDEVLSGAALVTLTQHLATCPACRAEWASFRKAVQAVADLGSVEPSPGFAARVRRRAEEPIPWQRVVRWFFLPLRVKMPIQAVALVLLAFAGLLFYQRSPELRRATAPSQVPSPPVARQAPAPAPPPPAEEPTRKAESPAARADAPKAKPAEPEAPPVAAIVPPPPPLEAGKERGVAAPRAEPKEAGKIGAPLETSKPAQPGAAARRLVQSAPAPLQAPAPEDRILSVPSGSADQLYSMALEDLGRRSYARVTETLRAFIQQHPRDARVPEARMRLGEVYVAQQRYKEAISEYETVVRDFSDSPLVPAALYRQAQARLELGDQSGCQMLRDVAALYPRAPEAALARETLSTRCR